MASSVATISAHAYDPVTQKLRELKVQDIPQAKKYIEIFKTKGIPFEQIPEAMLDAIGTPFKKFSSIDEVAQHLGKTRFDAREMLKVSNEALCKADNHFMRIVLLVVSVAGVLYVKFVEPQLRAKL